jgi:hypothetical protein
MMRGVRIHIRLEPMNRELPSLTEVRARRDLLARIAEWVDFDDAYGTEEELWLDVEDDPEALSLVEQVLADLELDQVATVEVDELT